MNSKLHTVCDGEGRPIIMLLSEGQMSDHRGARLVLNALPPAKTLIADRGYDSKTFREALQASQLWTTLKAEAPENVVLAVEPRPIELASVHDPPAWSGPDGVDGRSSHTR